MAEKMVKDLMVPLADYASVAHDAPLYQAVMALSEAQQRFHRNVYPHRAVLVTDQAGKVVGKIGQAGVLQAMEPKYRQIGDLKSLSRFGFQPSFLQSIMTHYDLLQKPLDDVCKKASRVRVEEIMEVPGEMEKIAADAGLNVAIHQMVVGQLQSLMVTEADDIVGIPRLSDVFNEICRLIMACPL